MNARLLSQREDNTLGSCPRIQDGKLGGLNVRGCLVRRDSCLWWFVPDHQRRSAGYLLTQFIQAFLELSLSFPVLEAPKRSQQRDHGFAYNRDADEDGDGPRQRTNKFYDEGSIVHLTGGYPTSSLISDATVRSDSMESVPSPVPAPPATLPTPPTIGRPSASRGQARSGHVCAVCGKIFGASKPTAKCCSGRCRIRLSRSRRVADLVERLAAAEAALREAAIVLRAVRDLAEQGGCKVAP